MQNYLNVKNCGESDARAPHLLVISKTIGKTLKEHGKLSID